jgi:hypothetical protein
MEPRRNAHTHSHDHTHSEACAEARKAIARTNPRKTIARKAIACETQATVSF